MELRIRTNKGLRPNLLDRFSGVIESDEMVQTVNFCLARSDSKEKILKKNLARLFGLIIHRLAGGRSISILFPYDIDKIRKKISGLNSDGKWVRIEITSFEVSHLIQILEAASFTTFYAQVGGGKAIPRLPAHLFKDNLKQAQFLVVFTLYDESMEVLSIPIPSDTVMTIAREVASEEGVRIV